jgi:hypothetical protein
MIFESKLPKKRTAPIQLRSFMPTDSEHPIPDTPQSPLSRLRMGLLILTIKQELAEPEHSVMGRVTFAYDVVQKRYSYAGEIERTLDDLKLTAELMAEVTEAKTTKHKTHDGRGPMAQAV